MEDIKTVLQIDFQGAQSIGDLKAKVGELRDELKACAAGSQEAADKAYELAKAENTLKAAEKGAIDTTGKLAKTYNGLSSEMARLKIAQKNIDISTKQGRKDYETYAKAINKLNDELKGLDAQNGVFVRNVGDYANSVKTALSGMGGAVTGVFSSITTGLKALVTNPWVAIIAAIVLAIKELVDAVKRNEDAMEGVNKAMNKVKAVYVTIQRIFDDLVQGFLNSKGKIKETFDSFKEWVSDVWSYVEPYAEKVGGFFRTIKGYFVSFLGFIPKFWDNVIKISIKGASYLVALAKALSPKQTFEEALQETQESWLQGWENIKDKTVEIFDDVKEGVSNAVKKVVGYVKGQYSDAASILDQITEAERKLAEQHIKNTTKVAENNKKIAELNAVTADRENHSIDEREKALEESAKLQKQNLEIQKKEAQEQLRILKLKHSLNQSTNADLQEEADLEAEIINLEAQEADVDRNVANQKRAIAKDRIKEQKEIISTEINGITQRLAVVQKGSDEELNLQKEKLTKQKELAILDAKERIKDEEELRKALLAIDAEYNQKEEQVEEQHKLALANARNLEAKNKANNAKLNNGSASLQYYQSELDAARTYYDNLFQLQGESNEEYEARQIAALQNVKNAEKQLNEQRISNYMSVAGGIADIMSTVASAWEDSIQRRVEAGEISEEEGEKEFENVKALQIAVATINTISGAIAAFMKSQELGQPWGMIIGAIQAAAVTAAGIAEIAKIKSTTLSSGASGGGSSVGGGFNLPPVSQYTPEYTQNLTGANDTQNLAGAMRTAIEGADIKAYVVESDITNAQKKADKRNSEATW